MSFHGVVNLLKPPGMTSHDAVAFVRRVLKEKRVGHTGTLDPAATGVLPICVGQATRLVEYLQAGTKEYAAEALFGEETDSGDLLGEVVAQAPTTHLNEEAVRHACTQFLGEIEQTPPMHSAIKVDGKKLYEIAREGGEVEIPVRQVTMSRLEMRHWRDGERPRCILEMECTGGTYVRSLVRDLGRALETRATMSFLVRTRSGAFTMADAVTMEAFAAAPQLMGLEAAMRACTGAVLENDHIAEELAHGRRVLAPPGFVHSSEAPILVMDAARTVFILGRQHDTQLAAEKVLRPEA